MLETRLAGDTDPLERYIWDELYVDAPMTIERDTNTDGTRDQRLWVAYDANYDVTSVLTDSGKVVERYAYTPYGNRQVLNGSSNYAGTGADPDGSDWSLDSTGDDYDLKPGHQGLLYDAETGQWQNRNRYYSGSLGGFTQRDPSGYADGYNLGQAYLGNPTGWVDPLGLQSIPGIVPDYSTVPVGPGQVVDPSVGGVRNMTPQEIKVAIKRDQAADAAVGESAGTVAAALGGTRESIAGGGDGFIPGWRFVRHHMGKNMQVDETSPAYHGGEALGTVAGLATGAGEIKGGAVAVEVAVPRIIQVVGGGTRVVVEGREVVVTAGGVLQAAVAGNAVVLHQTGDTNGDRPNGDYEPHPKHGAKPDNKGGWEGESPAPTDPQGTLDRAVKGPGDKLLGVDADGELAIFQPHGPGRWHGYVPGWWEALETERQAAIKAGILKRNGKLP